MAKRIIVADDLPNVTKALKLMLSPYYEVVEAFSGTDVLEYCEEQRIDGVLLDLSPTFHNYTNVY